MCSGFLFCSGAIATRTIRRSQGCAWASQLRPLPRRPHGAGRRTLGTAEASWQHDQAGRPYRSFRGLLEHLATLTRNQVRFAGTRATVPMLAEPTSAQREAFSLLGAAIPLTLK